ncbi:hypothetical protein H5410_050618 [Solanum commersonii]|uniref:Uncharacterized protein n=1 Tax=Solanum commersonii TaxID=4109 RepID=A0A9J5WXA2_SOLCO|nr:hypothetical protein H5410_050618 [Solanum commersonii]
MHNSEDKLFKNKGIYESIDSKGFSATYKDKEITYSFVTDPVTRDINALINMKQNHMDSLQLEKKIKLISEQIVVDICADHPSAFWNRKKHIVILPYEEGFSKDDIPTKSPPCRMNVELVEFCKNEIDNLLQKDFKYDASKLIFSRWQAQLDPFDFEIQYKKGVDNSLPDFLSREYLQ